MARLFLTSCSNPTLPWATDRLPLFKEALAARGHTLNTTGAERLLAAEQHNAEQRNTEQHNAEQTNGREHAGNSATISNAASPPWRWDPRERANLLNRAFVDPQVDAILDLSGGDLANEILPFLDVPAIVAHPKLMVGYSDMSCILGAIPHRTLLWNPLVGLETGFAELDRALDGETIRPELVPSSDIANRPWFAGNIRCFLKLAGTQLWPDLTGGILLIEGQGPSLTSVAALLGQHRTLGTFEKVAGVVVGQFTKIDADDTRPELLALVREYAGGLPVAEAPSIGHSETSGAVTLG